MALNKSTMALLVGAKGTPGGNPDNSADRPYELNRYMGGHKRINHPYISGYWYFIVEPPPAIFTQTGGDAGLLDKEGELKGPLEVTRWLHSTAEGFTPPTRTLTKIDVPGMGGTGSSFIAGQQFTRTFTTTFREYQDTPVLNSINLWTSMIDSHYGASPFAGNEYIPANYKGAAWVFLCKPTTGTSDGGAFVKFEKDDIEQFFFFEGVFPEAAPFDGFNSDIATNDATQLSVTWSFDGWPQGKEDDGATTGAFETGLTRLNTVYALDFDGTYENHLAAGAITYKAPTGKSTQGALTG